MLNFLRPRWLRDFWRGMKAREAFVFRRRWRLSLRVVLFIGLLGALSCWLSNCLLVPLTHIEGMRRSLERLEEAAR